MINRLCNAIFCHYPRKLGCLVFTIKADFLEILKKSIRKVMTSFVGSVFDTPPHPTPTTHTLTKCSTLLHTNLTFSCKKEMFSVEFSFAFHFHKSLVRRKG